jgi:HK97 family phage portal protein
MGFWDRFLGISSYDPAQRVLPEPYEPFVSTGGIPVMDPGTPLAYWIGGNADAEHMWRTQPSVRKVIGFAARNVASIPLHVHERVSDTERRRVTDHPLASVMSSPRPRKGSYRFWEAVLSDGMLYDRWAVLKRLADDGSMHLSRVPSWRLRFTTDALSEDEHAWFWNGDEWIELNLDDLIFDYGYAPKTAGLSPVETLRDLLDESAEAVEYRRQVWANGARAPQYVARPKEAGDWTPEQRERFVAGMRAYVKDGAKAGGIPLLEDGMKLEDGARMPSSDVLDLEGRKLSEVVVASAWHIAPELIGAREGNYSNVDAYRQMLYRDSLGPYITAWEQAINVGLTPDLADGRPLYVEANIESKLRGSFLEQAKVLQSATGAPWMLRDEARALMNRPPVPGGDQLVVPLNVLIGGQASPQDSGTQNERSGRPRVKAAPPQSHREKIAEVLAAFFARQSKVVLSRIGAGGDWWDAKRWDGELSDDLLSVTHTLAAILGKDAAEQLGYPDGYDADQTVNFLKAVSARYAQTVNATTKDALDEAIAADDGDPAHVFEVAQESRADGVGSQVATFAAGFATVEAAKQIARVNNVEPTKTWITGANPRPEHAAMDGQTVPIGEPFSDGNDWPGGLPGCNCSVEIAIP